MNRAAALVVCLFLLSCLTGCMTDLRDKTESVEQSGEGSLGSYYVKITDHFVASTATGKDVLILSFDFTNNGYSGVSAASALGLTLFNPVLSCHQRPCFSLLQGMTAPTTTKR